MDHNRRDRRGGAKEYRNQEMDGNGNSLGFDFTGHMRRLCTDISQRLSELNHVQMDRVAVTFSQARKRVRHGLWASLTPMRFRHGKLYERRRGQLYTVQRYYDRRGVEMMYILTFYLPRFQQLEFRDKLVTVFHELWHISPAFDGDIRRHPGRCYAHTRSEKEYDKQMSVMADRWLDMKPPHQVYAFLQRTFRELETQYGTVYGTRLPHPKLIPVAST